MVLVVVVAVTGKYTTLLKLKPLAACSFSIILQIACVIFMDKHGANSFIDMISRKRAQFDTTRLEVRICFGIRCKLYKCSR